MSALWTHISGSPAKKPHYGLLDTVRGICLISMIAYHGMYDLVDVFRLPAAWYHSWPGYVWQQSICWTFILLSGMCWRLSQHHIKRGLILVGCATAISLITWLAMPSQLILYGVLNLLGLSALLLIPLDKVFRKLPPWAGLAGALVLFVITRNIPRGSLGFEGWVFCQLPRTVPVGFSGGNRLSFPPILLRRLFPHDPLVFLILRGIFPMGHPFRKPQGKKTAYARHTASILFGTSQFGDLSGPPACVDGHIPSAGPAERFLII